LVVDANTTKIGQYELQKYDSIIFEPSDKWLEIDVDQMNPETKECLPLSMDTLRLTRKICVYSKGKSDIFEWTAAKGISHIILEGETSSLPIFYVGVDNCGFFENINHKRTAVFSTLFKKSKEGMNLVLRCNEFKRPEIVDFCRWDESYLTFKAVTVGQECKELDASCFYSINYLIMESKFPPKLSSPFKSSVFENTVLIVPEGSKSVYESDETWGKFKNIFSVEEFEKIVREYHEYEATMPKKYWETLPEDNVWTPGKSYWSDYDYLYFSDTGIYEIDKIINFEVSNRNNIPEFKNTVLYINGGFLIYEDDRDSDSKKWFYPYCKMKDLKEIVFGRKMTNFPYIETFVSSLEPPEQYSEVMPFSAETESEYVVWFNCLNFYGRTYTNKEHKWRNNVKELHIGPYVSKLPVSFPNVMDIFSAAETPPEARKETFTEEQYEYAIVRVPKGTLESYKAAPYWKDFKHITDVDPSGLERVIENPIEEMSIVNGILNIGYCGKVAHDVEVYTADGRMIYRGRDTGISVPKGIIIVRCGNQIRKMIN